MRLVSNWKRVLCHAYSIRFLLLAGILSGLEVALPLLDGILPVPPTTFAVLSGLCVCMAFIARLVAQDRVSGGGHDE
ncbi:hypothetical protein ASD50_14970 [Mesorhizobium sp. Root552]|uniref:DUF7940 domain-containing protein n=1 Tax=Mesorhizobium sp. Root552 TaxID=1736555 RepID=UPI0006FE9FE9|nr:hypothetical protein [Mesorhizobium sp. Root552]KQZ31569.1 hypothetical protein ASD50_14970 [Mesorhizobium sp. Root552]